MILITGANGFIGRRLVRHLNLCGLDIIPLFHSNRTKFQNDRWEADLTQPKHISLMKNAQQEIDTVVHLAGHVEIILRADPTNPLTNPVPGPENIELIYRENVIATANILSFCLSAGVKHMVFASSQTVYGMPVTNTITEKSPCIPLEHYANSKLCCEELLRIGVKQGIAVTALRFPGAYSEERRNGTVYEYCKTAIHKRKICVDTTMPLPFDIIYVDDIASAFKKAVQHGGDKWICLNIATGEPCSLDLLADLIAEQVPECEVEHSLIPQPVIRMDPSRAYELLGWKAVPQHERLRYMLDQVQNVE